ncbi:MAG: hypothetical protein HC877_20090 [Thioploca sp.]|nr:hypothetical protein [Thioploca sp.]
MRFNFKSIMQRPNLSPLSSAKNVPLVSTPVLLPAPVVGFEESGLRVEGKGHGIHMYSQFNPVHCTPQEVLKDYPYREEKHPAQVIEAFND